MISREEYKNLKIGDEVLINGTKSTIFYFEDGGVPVGVLENNANFGVFVSKNEKSQAFMKRYEALIKAGYPEKSSTYRLHDNQIEKILKKANPELKKLKKEDLKDLKIGDIVEISGLPSRIEALQVNNITGPWIFCRSDIDCISAIYPCGGNCHSSNKNYKLNYYNKYQLLSECLDRNWDISIKTNQKVAEKEKIVSSEIKDQNLNDSEENVMNEKTGFVGVVKSDADKAFWRSTAKNGTILLQKLLLKAMKDKGIDRKEITIAKKFLESEFGRGFLSMALGYGLTYAPLPDNMKDNKHLGTLAEELRVGGIQVGLDTILAGAMEYVAPLLDQIKTMLPDSEKDITAALPARIAKPTNKRIKASPKEDEEELEEVEVSEKTKKA